MESANLKKRSPKGGLTGALLRRQATGGRGSKCSNLLLSSTGGLKTRLRSQLEGVPEMIADVRKNLNSGTDCLGVRRVLCFFRSLGHARRDGVWIFTSQINRPLSLFGMSRLMSPFWVQHAFSSILFFRTTHVPAFSSARIACVG